MVSGHVISEIDTLRKSLITMVTFDFQLWIVNTHMLIEIRRIGETLHKTKI